MLDKKRKHWAVIDFSVPCDRNVLAEEEEKVERFTPLSYEIWKMQVLTTVIPLVIGALGVLSKNLQRNLHILDILDVIGFMQLSAVLGTAIILRKVLSGCILYSAERQMKKHFLTL